MRAYVDHVLALLPFEPAAHARLGGPPCTYVGHPAIELASQLRPNASEADRRTSDPPVLLVMPGSRKAELRRLSRIFGDAVAHLQAHYGPLDVVVPTVPQLLDRTAAATAAWPFPSRIVADAAEKHAAFRIARAALAKSGTVTLELAIAGVPMAVAYKVSLLEEAVGRLAIRVPSIVLANLVLGDNVIPQFVQRDCSASKLAGALAKLLGDTPERRTQVEAFAKLDAIMEIGRAKPSQRAAEIVLGQAALPPP
jgi:lipid-A-disaccharide synthase